MAFGSAPLHRAPFEGCFAEARTRTLGSPRFLRFLGAPVVKQSWLIRPVCPSGVPSSSGKESNERSRS
jgi:hypothetical protein